MKDWSTHKRLSTRRYLSLWECSPVISILPKPFDIFPSFASHYRVNFKRKPEAKEYKTQLTIRFETWHPADWELVVGGWWLGRLGNGTKHISLIYILFVSMILRALYYLLYLHDLEQGRVGIVPCVECVLLNWLPNFKFGASCKILIDFKRTQSLILLANQTYKVLVKWSNSLLLLLFQSSLEYLPNSGRLSRRSYSLIKMLRILDEPSDVTYHAIGTITQRTCVIIIRTI